MRHISTHRLGLDQGSSLLFSDFKHDGEMWTGEGKRELIHRIEFSERFLTPPAVQVGLSMWDVDHTANQRMDIMAENVSEDGFDLVFRTWGDTRIARVRAEWIALGDLPHDDDWDV